MGKLLKAGRVVVVTAGRYAGRKAVIVNATDNVKGQKYGNALVAGVARPPRKVHKRLSSKKLENRAKCRAFIKNMNQNHLLPTRYSVSSELDPKLLATFAEKDKFESPKAARRALADLLNEKFLKVPSSSKNAKDLIFLRKRLRF